jgi:IS30 family transposase
VQPSDYEIAELYEDEKLSIGQIAKRFEIGKATVWRALRRTDTESRKMHVEKLDRSEVARVFEEKGRSIAETAKHFGVAQYHIRRSLIRAGVYKPIRLGGIEHLEKWHKSGDADFRNQVVILHKQGTSRYHIARQLDTTKETVDYALYLHEKGITEAACQNQQNKPAPEPEESDISTDSTPVDSSPASEEPTTSKSSGVSTG